MANKKISQLNNLTAGNQEDTDLIEVARSSSAENFKFSWANIKAALKTYFDTFYATLTSLANHIANFNDHSARHESGGDDEISVAGLSGELADNQPLKEHSNTKHSTNLVGEAGVIAAMTEKETPVDDDVGVIEDSIASNAPKKLSWANIKATLKAYFDTIYDPLGGAVTTLTLIPYPNGILAAANALLSGGSYINSTTTAQLGQIIIPYNITVNKVSIDIVGIYTEGAIKIGFYAEDGSEKVLELTTASISGTGIYTKTLDAPYTFSRGVYYVAAVAIGAADLAPNHWQVSPVASLHGGIANEPKLAGYLTVTAETLPSTIDPTAILMDGITIRTLIVRLDN